MDAPIINITACYDDEDTTWYGIIKLTVEGMPTVSRHMYSSDTPDKTILHCMGYVADLINKHGSIEAFIRDFWGKPAVKR